MSSYLTGLSFESHQLVTAQGAFPKIDFSSELQEELAFRLQDPDLAAQMNTAFEKHIKPTLQEQETKPFFEAFISIVMVLSKKALQKALQEKGLKDWVEREPLALENFLRDATPRVECKAKEGYRICILTTTASGGNQSVTRAVEAWLKTYPHIVTRVINVESIAEKYDSFKIATGEFTYDGLYDAFFQKQNAGNAFLFHRDDLNKKIASYVGSRTIEKMKEVVCEFSPHLLVTTRTYKEDDLSIGTCLNIPTRVLYCDYDISFYHLHLIGKTDPRQLQFWFPSLKPESFKPLFQFHNAGHLFDPGDNFEQVARKIAQITHSTFEEIRDSFAEVGFPVGSEFHPISDHERIGEIQKKWRLPSDVKAVLVTMGKNGVKNLETVFETLAKASGSKKMVKYYFVCGTNAELKKKLTETSYDHIEVFGFLSHQDTSELMAISSLMISKPGGSTVGECQEMGLPMLPVHSHDLWEGGNERQLRNLGLGYRYQSDIPLEKQVEACLDQGSSKPHPSQWKDKLGKILNLS